MDATLHSVLRTWKTLPLLTKGGPSRIALPQIQILCRFLSQIISSKSCSLRHTGIPSLVNLNKRLEHRSSSRRQYQQLLSN
uniref:Uncharacterized protein n=1 Tax=Rhizophora mucronata TaxID=61149 RepID=A0A2P2MZ67_RHIMU